LPSYIDRLPMLVELRLEGDHQATISRNAEDPVKDRNGSSSTALADNLRFFGVADYLLKSDVESFRQKLSESAKIQDKLFDRFDNGEPIDGSYVTMLSYKSVFDALAAGDLATAKSLASHMGGRASLEKEHDHPFDYAMGYTLRALVLNDSKQIQEWPAKLLAACAETGMTDFNGYGQVFQAIHANDSASANDGLKAIVKGHQKQSKGKGVFAGTKDEVLCIWGVGMANLAQYHGLQVEAVPPLIPEDLLA